MQREAVDMSSSSSDVQRLILINGLRPDSSADLYDDMAGRLRASGVDVVLVNGPGERIPVIRQTDLVVSNVELPAWLENPAQTYAGRAVPRPESMAWMASAGIPTMEWALARARRDVRELFEKWGVDRLILKPSFTGGGRGVRVFTRGALWRLWWDPDQDLFCREVNPDDGSVYKAELFNGHLVTAWVSHAAPLRDVFKRGIYRGLKGAYGDRELVDFSKPLCDQLCFLSRGLMARGLGYVSVDLMHRSDGELVAIELNTRDVATWWTRQFPDMRHRYATALQQLVAGLSLDSTCDDAPSASSLHTGLP